MFEDVTFRLSTYSLDCLNAILNDENFCFSSLDSALEYCILRTFQTSHISRGEDSCN